MIDILQKRERKDTLKMIYDDSTFSLSEIYHEASKLNEFNGRSFRRRIGAILGPEYFLKLIAQGYKTYPTSEVERLPRRSKIEDPPLATSLNEILKKRRSVREFSGRPISLENLSTILGNSYGVTGRFMMAHNVEQRVRAVPSGGALFPLEVYAACLRVEGLAPAIYHYNVREHSLEKVRDGLFDDELGRAFFYEEMFKQVSVSIIMTGVLKRSSLKYGERAYRFMTIEAGHIGQNICLSASALNLGCVMLGGFFDDALNQLLEIDGVHEMTLYGSAIGCID